MNAIRTKCGTRKSTNATNCDPHKIFCFMWHSLWPNREKRRAWTYLKGVADKIPLITETSLSATSIEQVMLNEAKTSRPRPELRGRGRDQFLEVDAKAEAKNNCEKVPNND